MPSNNDRNLDFHPGMGMRWEITRSTEDTAGELFEATNCRHSSSSRFFGTCTP